MKIQINKIVSIEADEMIEGIQYTVIQYIDQDLNNKISSDFLNDYQLSKLVDALMSGSNLIFDAEEKTIIDFDPKILLLNNTNPN